MQIKGIVLLAAAAASSSLVSAESTGQNQINIHRQFKIDDRVCVTKNPITYCNNGFQPIYEQESQRSVEMFCLDADHKMADQMVQMMETGYRKKSLEQEADKRTYQVPKVQKCKVIRLTTDGEVEDDKNTQVSEHQQQHGGLRFNRNKFNNSGKHQQQQYQSKQEREQQYETIRDEQKEHLQKLRKLMPEVENAIQLSQNEYEQVYELVKKIARSDEQIEGPLFMLNKYLPNAFAKTVHRVRDELITENMEDSEQRQVTEQLKKLAERVYILALTRLSTEHQKKPINEQLETSFTNWEEYAQYFERLWNNIQKDMDQQTVKAIERQVERSFRQQIEEEQEQELQAWELSQVLEKSQKEQKREQQHLNLKPWEQTQEPQQWESEMTNQQRKQQELILTKIVMAGLKTAEQIQKDQKNQQKPSANSPLFSGLFNNKSGKQQYPQLIKQVKNQFAEF